MHISSEDKILIISPHPDDETIGCGGLLVKYGSQCDIMLLTDGRRGYLQSDEVDEDKLASVREAELRNMAKSIGVKRVIALHIPDGYLSVNRKRVVAEDISSYSMIFVPNHLERHKDHSVVTEIVQSMIKKKKLKCSLYEYEVWSPLMNPTDYIDISDVIEQKQELLSFYQSQLKYVDYLKMSICLNGYRGAGQKVSYAEAYNKVLMISFFRRLYYILPHKVRKVIHKCLAKVLEQ